MYACLCVSIPILEYAGYIIIVYRAAAILLTFRNVSFTSECLLLLQYTIRSHYAIRVLPYRLLLNTTF